jgi:hypothetical protein
VIVQLVTHLICSHVVGIQLQNICFVDDLCKRLQIIVYKIDGSKEKLFCQNLCLFSKMFLDGKTLIWEVCTCQVMWF